MKVFLFIDCQNDFFGSGNLEVPNSDSIRCVLEKLIKLAKDDNIPVLKIMDAHIENDPEFNVYPPHCIKGTEGYASIIECSCKKAIIFEKATYNVFDKKLGNKDFKKWLKDNNVTDIYVAGVCTEICIKDTVIGLCKLKEYNVYVFKNAICHLDEKKKDEAINEMIKSGAYMAQAKLK